MSNVTYSDTLDVYEDIYNLTLSVKSVEAILLEANAENINLRQPGTSTSYYHFEAIFRTKIKGIYSLACMIFAC